MKLKEFVEDVYKTFNLSPETDIITGEQLEFFLPHLSYVDEFENCVLKTTQISQYLETRKWGCENDNIKGTFLIYEISLSPEIHPIDKPLNYMVKNDAGIGPLLYDHKSCTTFKEIRIRIDPCEFSESEDAKCYYVNLIRDIFNNPDDYRIKGERYVMIRGNFEDVIYLK